MVAAAQSPVPLVGEQEGVAIAAIPTAEGDAVYVVAAGYATTAAAWDICSVRVAVGQGPPTSAVVLAQGRQSDLGAD